MALVAAAALGTARAQPASPGAYEDLTPAQRRVIAAWASETTPAGRQGRVGESFDAAPAPFRAAFRTVTVALASVLLFDPENGEVLGAALDLIDGVEPPSRQPPSGGGDTSQTVAVSLASGALDRLRRSAEFQRVDGGSAAAQSAFVHGSPPRIRIALEDRTGRALVTVFTP